MSVYDRLAQWGLELPDLAPTAEFIAVKVVDDRAYVSGHAPFQQGEFQYRGKVGRELDVAAGRRAAECAVLGCLRSLESAIGSLDAVRGIDKVNGYVNCTADFEDLPAITDAASEVLVRLFGDPGRHARTTVGVMSLPCGVAVEIELIVRVEVEHLG